METNQLIENENLTIFEKETLQALINELYAEPGFSDVSATDIGNIINLPTMRLRGVLSSLVKKGYIQIDDNDEYQIIYLKRSKYYLHPKWSKEA